MCGLAGIFSPQDGAMPDDTVRRLLRSMSDTIVHRGPDEAGEHIEPYVALAHRRLSIIDLATGQQPLFNEDGSVVIVYNGEIYNFAELRSELASLGHRFRTRSDTEVVVHAWEQWGERCVDRFRGMFAFALWDRRQRTLFLARDRIGVKPLYYALLADGRFVFGSELKALTAVPQLRREINPLAVEDFFAFGYIPDPKTIYVDALKLPPAHTLTYVVGASRPRLRRYWDLTFEAGAPIRFADAVAELRERLTDVVRMRMVSEVPIGAFLSGGVDSGTVVGLMASLSSTPIRTCSIGFDRAAFDESEQARQVADRHRTNHYSEIVSSSDFALADRIVRIYDEPFADSSALPTYQVCRLARRHVTVALSGDGGDEAFGGYRRYRLHLMEERFRRMLPLGFRRALFRPLGDHFPKLDRLPRPFRAKTTLQALGRSAVEAYFHSISLLDDVDRARLFTPAFRQRLGGYRALEVFEQHARTAPKEDPLALIQYLDYHTYLPGDINTKVDRASMAHSLEVRDPLMDHDLIEWLATMPADFKIGDGQSKRLLKEAARPLLPESVLNRTKMGFAVPLADWFRGRTGETLERDLKNGVVVQAGILDEQRVATLCDEHRQGRRNRSAALWAMFCLERFLMQETQADPSGVSLHEQTFE